VRAIAKAQRRSVTEIDKTHVHKVFIKLDAELGAGRYRWAIVGRALPFLSNDEIVRQLSIKFIRAAAKTPLPPLVESGSGKLNDGAGNVGAPVDPTTLNLLISCVGGFLLICANGPGWWANSGRRFHASPVIQCVKLAAQARGAAAARTIAAPSMPGDHALQP